MPVTVKVPAFNIDPHLAKKFEERIGEIMFAERRGERAKTDDPTYRPPKLPSERSGIQKGRPDNPTDLTLLRILRTRECTITELSKLMGIQRNTIRMALDRLLSRKMVGKRKVDKVHVWWAVGQETQDGCAPHA